MQKNTKSTANCRTEEWLSNVTRSRTRFKVQGPEQGPGREISADDASRSRGGHIVMLFHPARGIATTSEGKESAEPIPPQQASNSCRQLTAQRTGTTMRLPHHHRSSASFHMRGAKVRDVVTRIPEHHAVARSGKDMARIFTMARLCCVAGHFDDEQ